MTALAKQRSRQTEAWKFREFPVPMGYIAHQGGIAAIETTAGAAQGKVIPGASVATLVVIGVFAETVDAMAAASVVTVDLCTEVHIEWFANATAGDAVTAAHVGQLCYLVDDQTVMITAANKSIAGRVWAVNPLKGVAVELLRGH